MRIQHIDLVQKGLEDWTPDFQLKTEGTPRTGQEDQSSQKTVVGKQAQQEYLHHGEWQPEKEGNWKWTSLQASDNTWYSQGMYTHTSTWWTRTQWFQENTQCSENLLPLGKAWSGISSWYCRKMQNMCTTQCPIHNNSRRNISQHHHSPWNLLPWDLIGEFHPASSKGNRYALTAICMLTGFTFYIPLKFKKAKDVFTAYLNYICCVFVTNSYLGSIPVTNELHQVSKGSKGHLISGGWQQLFMGFSSCTGPTKWMEELQAVMLGEEVGWWGTRWLQYLCSDVEIVPPMGHLVCEEYKHSAWEQPLLVTPKDWLNTLQVRRRDGTS